MLASVLLALAGLGVWAVRGPASSPRSARDAAAPLAVLTSPAGVQPATPAGRCGPARWVNGVPVGWQDSRAGAVSAAAGYAKTMSTMWFLTDRDRRHRAMKLLATAEQAATLTASQDLLAAELLDGPLGPALANNGTRAVLTTALRARSAGLFRWSRVPRWEPDAPPGSLGTGRPARR